MGYSMRSDNWRLAEWVAWNKTAGVPMWEMQVGLELYNHTRDFGEDLYKSAPVENVAAEPWNDGVVAKCRRTLLGMTQ